MKKFEHEERRHIVRAINRNTRQWEYGFYACLYEKHLLFRTDDKKFYDYEPGCLPVVDIIPETICRYTLYDDKNGTPVFEHDILNYTDYRNTDSGLQEVPCEGDVKWDDETLSFYITNRISAESYEIISSGETFITGNFFDNQKPHSY